MDCVFVRYWTIHVVSVLNCILSYTVLKCFKQRQSIENTCFYLKGGRGGQKMSSISARGVNSKQFIQASIVGKRSDTVALHPPSNTGVFVAKKV